MNPGSLPRPRAGWSGCGGGRADGTGGAGRAWGRGGVCNMGELESARRVKRNIFIVSEFLLLFIFCVLFFLDFFLFF